MTSYDYKKSLLLLKQINGVRYKGAPVLNSFFCGPYNIWQTYQQRLFAVVKTYSSGETFRYDDIAIRWTYYVWGSIALFVSIAAVVFSRLFSRKVLVYSIDREHSYYKADTRLDHLYSALHGTNTSFVECFHTILDRRFITHFLKRRRLAIYLEAIDFLYFVLSRFGVVHATKVDRTDLDFSLLNSKDKEFAEYVVTNFIKRVSRTNFRINIFSRWLRHMRTTQIFAIDDSRDYFEIMHAALLTGVHTQAIQHGHITKYHVGWLKAEGVEGEIMMPEKIYVWSDYWKSEMIRLGTYFDGESIVVGGPKLLSRYELSKSHVKKSDAFTILVPHETDAPIELVREFIQKALECTHTKVIFKVRPGVNVQRQLNEYGAGAFSGEKFIISEDVDSIINDVDVVVGTYSTLLYDLIAYEKPIGYLVSDFDYGEGLVVNGIADTLVFNSGGDLCDRLRVISNTSKEVLRRRKDIVFGKETLCMEQTLVDILKESQS